MKNPSGHLLRADAALLDIRRETSIFMASIARRRNRAAAQSLHGTLCVE
jgi:hypothetical protein